MKINIITALIFALGLSFQAQASVLTTSPTSKAFLPVGVSLVGGIVTDLVGTNGVRLVSQLSASSLYEGFAGANPETIGTQSGFTPALLANLGGGIVEAAFRITLYDGDTAAGNFDFNENLLLVNGQTIGNFSSVSTTNHNGDGTVLGSSNFGFENDLTGTGFFYNTNAAVLSAIYTSLSSTGTFVFQLNDADPFDNYYDFKQGISTDLINVGTPPTISVIPEPSSTLGLGMLIGIGLLSSRNRRK